MWYIVLSLIAAIYVIINFVIPSTFSGFVGAYIIRPLLWISLAILVFLTARQEGLNIWQFKKIRKWEIGKTPFHAALLIGGFQVSLLIIAGLFAGFGESPYSSTPSGIATNLLFMASALFGIELSRAYLIKKGTSTTRNITLILASVTILFMFINIAPAAFSVLNFNEPAESVKFIGETIIPLLAMGLFASYLAYLGGALAAIGYMGILRAFEWFSPVLPDLDWALMALIGTIGPAIGFLIIQNSIQLTHGRHSRRAIRKTIKDPTLKWTGVAVISLLVVFFSFGYLGVQPTVIYSGSMRPSMDVGDIILISEVPIDEIEEGDVIQYRTANANIIHRVYEKFEEEGTTLFITKGDANSKPDSNPIFPEQIAGKAVFNIPKLGWIPIFIKSLVNKVGLTII
jgi:signal peptidase